MMKFGPKNRGGGGGGKIKKKFPFCSNTHPAAGPETIFVLRVA